MSSIPGEEDSALGTRRRLQYRAIFVRESVRVSENDGGRREFDGADQTSQAFRGFRTLDCYIAVRFGEGIS
jgi:hypothetical protein